MLRVLVAPLLCLIIVGEAVRADAVDDLVQHEISVQKIPGISIAVIENGKILKARGYGFADLELDVPASAETVYQLASVTKQFTAAAIMLLAEDGKLDLDDKISKHLTNAPDAWNQITVRQLLTMTSGIKDYNQPLGDSHDDFDYEKLERLIASFPLQFQPGTKWAYSNSNYILLALLIQRITGKTYDEFLADRVFRPFGMTTTRRDNPSDLVKNRAALYELKGSNIVNSRFVNPTLFNNGDGGLLTTVLDMAKWDAALYPGKLFKASALEQIWQPASFDGRALKHYGFGWYLNEAGNQRIALHGGGRPGSSTQISRFLDAKITVVVLINRSGVNAEKSRIKSLLFTFLTWRRIPHLEFATRPSGPGKASYSRLRCLKGVRNDPSVGYVNVVNDRRSGD
jgi:CubicO group peptidase (beta-lactamase class C family)